MTNRRGGIRKEPADRQSIATYVYLTPEQATAIGRLADYQGMSVSALLRTLAIAAVTEHQT